VLFVLNKGQNGTGNLFNYLFHLDAKLIPSGKNKEGIYGARFMTPQERVWWKT
jgi:hypothetical protein